MPGEATKVLYDIASALSKLDQLDKRVTKSGTEQKLAFDKAQTGLKGLGGRVSKVTGLTFKMAKSFGVVAGGATAIVFAVGKLATSLDDTDAKIQGLLRTADKVLEIQNKISAIGDAGELRGLEDQSREIRLEQAAQKGEQNRLEIVRDRIKKEINLEKGKFREIQGLRRKAASDTESAEKRLADKRKELAGEQNVGGNQTKGGQVGELTSKARSEASKGNVDSAEALIDRAKTLSAELGDHVFFTNQIDSAQQAVVRALEKDVKEAKKKESALKAEEKQLSQNLKVADAVLESFNEKLKVVLRTNRELSKEKQILRDSRKQTVDAQDAEEAERTVTSSTRKASETAGAAGQQSFLAEFGNNVSRLLSGLKSPGTIGTVQGTNDEIQSILKDLATINAEQLADGKRTPDEIAKLGQFLEKATERSGALQTGIDAGTLNASPQIDLNRLTTVLTQLEQSLTAAEQARSAGVQGSEGIGEGARRIRQQQQDTLAQRETVKEVNQNITISATTTQGKFDAEAVRQIREIVQTETRKGT